MSYDGKQATTILSDDEEKIGMRISTLWYQNLEWIRLEKQGGDLTCWDFSPSRTPFAPHHDVMM